MTEDTHQLVRDMLQSVGYDSIRTIQLDEDQIDAVKHLLHMSDMQEDALKLSSARVKYLVEANDRMRISILNKVQRLDGVYLEGMGWKYNGMSWDFDDVKGLNLAEALELQNTVMTMKLEQSKAED